METQARLREVETFARELIAEHVPDYSFEWMNKKQTLGECIYYGKKIRLSRHYVLNYSDDLVIDTILHEIAHAKTPLDRGHGASWKRACIEIGAKPQRCKSIERVGHTWERQCVNKCNAPTRFFRKPKIDGYICRKCRGNLRAWRVG